MTRIVASSFGFSMLVSVRGGTIILTVLCSTTIVVELGMKILFSTPFCRVVSALRALRSMGAGADREQTAYDTQRVFHDPEPMCTKGIAKCNSGDSTIDAFACQAAFTYCNTALTTPYRATGLNPYDIRKPCVEKPLCYDFSHVEKFMNSDATKKALHVDGQSSTWKTCNMMISMKFHSDWMKDFAPYVADLLNDGIPALIYAGDVDFVYDAGHMVAADQPEHALTMITQFLNGESLCNIQNILSNKKASNYTTIIMLEEKAESEDREASPKAGSEPGCPGCKS
eukprot:scaffold9071_cov108-Skeletonema_dohrnii-CCMP3373.AAC.5